MAKQKPQASPSNDAAEVVAVTAVEHLDEVAAAGAAAIVPPPGGDLVAAPAGVTAESVADSSVAVASGAVVALGPDTVAEPGEQQNQEQQAPPVEDPPGVKVSALVLSDNAFGRCGEVREFDAAHAPVIEAGGFIDTHPNAVASAKGS